MQKTKIFGEQTVAARSDVIAKKLLEDCFKTVADGPKTGLLAARAISSLTPPVEESAKKHKSKVLAD